MKKKTVCTAHIHGVSSIRDCVNIFNDRRESMKEKKLLCFYTQHDKSIIEHYGVVDECIVCRHEHIIESIDVVEQTSVVLYIYVC